MIDLNWSEFPNRQKEQKKRAPSIIITTVLFIMKSFSFDNMVPQLLFVTGNGDSHSIIKRIMCSIQNTSFSEVFLSGVNVDTAILNTLIRLLSSREWNGLHMAECSGLIPDLIEASSPLVAKLSILGDSLQMNNCCCQSLSRGLQLPNTKLKKIMLRVQLSEALAKALDQSLGSKYCKVEELIVPISISSPSSVALLANALRKSKSLKALKLNRHDLEWTMNEYQASTLMKSLEGHPSLKELSIQGSSCTDFGIRAMSGSIVNSLYRLDLSNHPFGGDELRGIQSLSHTLCNPNTLQYLSISGHSLSQEDVLSIADALSHESSRIEELHMNNCNLDDSSIIALAESLPRLKILKRLFLHDNPFGHSASAAFAIGTSKNWELEHLVLPRRAGQGADDSRPQIEYHLALNRAGRKLLRTNVGIPLSVWPIVLHRVGKTLKENYFSNAQSAHHADAIYHLLQGPVLLER